MRETLEAVAFMWAFCAVTVIACSSVTAFVAVALVLLVLAGCCWWIVALDERRGWWRDVYFDNSNDKGKQE